MSAADNLAAGPLDAPIGGPPGDGRRPAATEEQETRRTLAWRIFFEASTRLQGVLETRLKADAKVSLVDYNILLTLYEAPGRSFRMGELAEHLGFIPSRTTYLVSGLIKDGLVEKRQSGRDGRGYVVTLTPKGVQQTELATQIHQNTVRGLLLDDLTDAHIDGIVEAFEHLEDTLRDAHFTD